MTKKINPSKIGFTLIECLWALVVLAFVLWGIQANWELLNITYRLHREDHTADFHQFALLLEKELTKYQVAEIQPHMMLVEDKQSYQKYTIECKNDKIYKSPGHHPYLYEVQEWQLSLEGELLWVSVLFNSGQAFETYFFIEDNSLLSEGQMSNEG